MQKQLLVHWKKNEFIHIKKKNLTNKFQGYYVNCDLTNQFSMQVHTKLDKSFSLCGLTEI